MRFPKTTSRHIALAALAAGVLAFALMLAGCGGDAGSTDKPGSAETSLSADQLRGPTTPPPLKLDTPEAAVRSYLSYITLAYYILDSDVATQTLTPEEEVRVNSYVQLNKEQGRAIDQTLTDFKIEDVRSQGDTATVTVEEAWEYRYIDFVEKKYSSPKYEVEYQTTYTVTRDDDGLWRVAKVQAVALGEEPK